MNLLRGFAIACTVALAGCDDNAADAQRKANAAQSAADDKIGVAAREADAKMKGAQIEADKKIAEADATFAKLRTDYRATVKTALVDLDKKIGELSAKALTSTGKSKTDLEARLKLIGPSRDAFAADYDTLEKTMAPSWDATKARIDKELTELKAAVDKA